MDYSTILTKFRTCMVDIGNALRSVLGTSQKYKFTEVANAIRSCNQVYYLGTGTSFSVSHIPGYSALTAANFIVCSATCTGKAEEFHKCSAAVAHQKSYNASTGVLTITGGYAEAHDAGASSTCRLSMTLSSPNVYLVKGSIK